MSQISALKSAIANRGTPVPTAISLVVDRSGSMSPYVQSVVDSVFRFIKDQQEVKGSASFTLAQFDHDYEVVYQEKDIKKVDANRFSREYSPRGGTALRDAVVRAIEG